MRRQATTLANAHERFWGKPERIGDCLVWPATQQNHSGYGLFYCDGKYRAAHRIAYILAHGPIPDGMFVCHRCDNPSCVNPEHLFLGTHQDNMDDCTRKGRHARGDRSGPRLHPEKMSRGEHRYNAKLTDDLVREIRRLHQNGMRGRAIGKAFGITESAVSAIVHGKSWKHVT